MGAFINTIDVIGRNALESSFIDRSITEFKDENIWRVGAFAFMTCAELTMVDLPSATYFDVQAFMSCKKLTTVVLRSETGAFFGASLFSDTPIASGTGYIYVPRALVEDYKNRTGSTGGYTNNWANQYRAIEDYTVDGTIHGELDESKI